MVNSLWMTSLHPLLAKEGKGGVVISSQLKFTAFYFIPLSGTRTAHQPLNCFPGYQLFLIEFDQRLIHGLHAILLPVCRDDGI